MTRTHDLLITKCIGVLHLTVFRDLGAFPLGILWEVHPILSTVSIHSFRCVGHGVGQQMLLEKTSLNKFAGLPPEELYEKRLEQENPVLDALLSWTNEMQVKTVPKSTLGKAIHYLLEQWPYLIRYLEDGRLDLSNNRAECSIKPFVMGRKNWLFTNTVGGAQTSAVIYSLIETAKENGLDPYRYLLWVLRNAPGQAKQMKRGPKNYCPPEPWKNAIQW